MRILLVAALVAPTLLASAVAKDEAPPLALEMTPGAVRMIQTDERVKTVIVGDDTAADVSVVSDVRVAVTAKKAGNTSLVLLSETHRVIGNFNVSIIPADRASRKVITVRTGHKPAMEYLCDTGCVPGSANVVSEVPQTPVTINMSAPAPAPPKP